jgi:hypothetical protein
MTVGAALSSTASEAMKLVAGRLCASVEALDVDYPALHQRTGRMVRRMWSV